MLKSIWLKLSGALAAISAILIIMLKSEKSKRKAAELEASIEKSNRETLEKERDIISDIDGDREVRDEKRTEKAIYNAEHAEALKNNDSNDAVVDGIFGMLNKNNHSSKAPKDS